MPLISKKGYLPETFRKHEGNNMQSKELVERTTPEATTVQCLLDSWRKPKLFFTDEFLPTKSKSIIRIQMFRGVIRSKIPKSK